MIDDRDSDILERRGMFPRSVLDGSIIDRFREQAGLHPDRVAVRHDNDALTYAALDARAGGIAAALRRRVPAESGPVAILLPQGAGLIAGTLGILESGKAYLPLDIASSETELLEWMNRARPGAVLTDTPGEEKAIAVAAGRCPVVRSNDAPPAANTRDVPRLDPDTVAYVYFTSGTTGEPKGVVDTHRNVLHNVMRYTRTLGFVAEDRMTVLQAATFSGVVSSMFGGLLNGAMLLPYDTAALGMGPPLAAWLAREAPTILHCVPTIFRTVCITGAAFPSIRLVRLEGDAAVPADVRLFRRHFAPDCLLVNGLGTTETGICRQFFVRADTPIPEHVLPVGYPVEDMDVRVIDAMGGDAPPGDIGEIVVRSRYLARGYWHDTERTVRVFGEGSADSGPRTYRTGDLGRMRADGCLEHLGRIGDQVKVRGQWVDFAAVERACESLEGVRQAAVVAERGADGEASLAAYLVPEEDFTPTAGAFRRAMDGRLPSFMMPSCAWLVASLPTTVTGKLDRHALIASDARSLPNDGDFAPARTTIERTLVEIWCRALRLPYVGIHDPFTELGGTSLAAARVLAEIESKIGRSIPLSTFMESRTIADLGRVLTLQQEPTRTRTLIHVQPAGGQVPLFCVHDPESDPFLFAPLARHLGSSQPVFAMRYRSGEPVREVPRSIPELASRYLADLRAVRPHGPYRLAGFCFGAVVALEMAHRLEAQGEHVDRLAFFNVSPFDFPDLVTPAARRRFRVDVMARLRYLAQKPSRVRWVGRRIRRVLTEAMWRLWATGLRRWAPAHPADRELVRATLRQAFRRHRSHPIAAPLLLCLASDNLRLYADDPMAAWGPLLGDAGSIRRFPRDGYAMLLEPDVTHLASALQTFLDPDVSGAPVPPASGLGMPR